MKKLLLIIAFLPFMAFGQKFEFGINYGNTLNTTASINLFNHLKVGIGYEYITGTEESIFGGKWLTEMYIPFCYVDYYKVYKKNEFYIGLETGNFSKINYTLQSIKVNGYEYGFHIGYSIYIFKNFAANAQIGMFNYNANSVVNSTSFNFSYSTNGTITPITIGIHYIIAPFRKSKH